MAEILLENVQKSYGKVEVIQNVNFTINDGEFVVIVGPSGCGKSTLLRMIAGLESISEGDISIGGRVVNDLEPAERDIAMVFQNYALYPHMTVFNNMAYGLKIKKIPKDEIEKRVNRVAKILEIEDYLQRSPRQLSGGQRQRVAMGRAIVREPSVFLFDEPLSNLDAKLRVQMRLQIKTLQENLGITSVYVTHDQVEAMTLGHRLAVLNGGYVEQLGTPIEIYEKPASVFVAGFIGSPSMNLMAAEIDKSGGSVVLSNGKSVKLNTAVPDHAGQKITFGIRPEHMEITTDKKANLELTVEIVEQLGADTLVHGTLLKVQDFVVRLEGVRSFTSGEKLHLAAAPGSIHLFDGQTEKRIES
ncbi:MAG: sn-glycerol-3-phosphate ABC transporter ATP-binding protein UgpC [Marinosulfonomonas sp.]|nr:MAG: sn-glycerol-3-phosphate ABC transporter ATP-binding protein UgpC [Marinosulfonomonas sp.]